MDIEYYREINHNYLILSMSDEERPDAFQSRMLTEQKWRHLALCTERVINGRKMYYYVINSIISLTNYFSARKMKKEDMILLLDQLEETEKELSDYLMDEDNILLDPEYIFFDMEKNEYRFIFYPIIKGKDKTAGECMTALLDFMLERADDSDGQVPDFIYGIYEKATQENFVLAEVFGESSAGKGDGPQGEVANEDSDKADICHGYDEEIEMSEDEGEPAEETGHPCKGYLAAGIAALASLMGPVCIYFMYELTSKEKMILSGAAGAIVFTAVCFTGLYFRSAKCGPQKAKDDDADLRKKGNRKIYDESAEYEALAPLETKNSERKTADIGKTEFFQPVKELNQYKLYASDRKNRQHIALDKLPCTIGKQAECVDRCINGKGVSRIHARVDHNGSCFTVTDLNSTNGTYVNGVPLGPNEMMELSVGDEVRFGDLNYCLR